MLIKLLFENCTISAATVGFTETSRSFSESIDTVTFTASISNPSSTDITVRVTDSEGSATSK